MQDHWSTNKPRYLVKGQRRTESSARMNHQQATLETQQVQLDESEVEGTTCGTAKALRPQTYPPTPPPPPPTPPHDFARRRTTP